MGDRLWAIEYFASTIFLGIPFERVTRFALRDFGIPVGVVRTARVFLVSMVAGCGFWGRALEYLGDIGKWVRKGGDIVPKLSGNFYIAIYSILSIL